MVPRRHLPIDLHETVIEWLCGRVPGIKDRRCRRIEWKYVLERTRCGRLCAIRGVQTRQLRAERIDRSAA